LYLRKGVARDKRRQKEGHHTVRAAHGIEKIDRQRERERERERERS